MLGLAALPGLGDGKQDRADEPQDQGQPGGEHPAHQSFVPPGELAQVIQGRRRPRQDRLVGQPAPQVRRQIRRRRVAPRRVLLQRPGPDRLQIAAEFRSDHAETRWVVLQDQPGRLGQRPVLQGIWQAMCQ